MHRWHKEELGGLETRLKSMRLFPSFFNVPPAGTAFGNVDGSPFIECLRQFSSMADARNRSDSPAQYNVGGRLDQIWLEGAATRLLLAMVSSHVQSTTTKRKKPKQTPDKLTVSWSGASAAIGLYLNPILGIFNAGQPLEDRLHRRVLFILKGDLDRDDYIPGPNRDAASDYWFWRAFLGAFSIAKHERCGKADLSRAFRQSFDGFVGEWAGRMGVRRWDEARGCLEAVVWPSDFGDDALAEEVWGGAVSMVDWVCLSRA